MKLELGKSYRNNNKDVIDIIYVDKNLTKEGRQVFVDRMSRSYYEDGTYFYEYKLFDLVEVV